MNNSLLTQLNQNNEALKTARNNEDWDRYEDLQKERIDLVRRYVNLSEAGWQKAQEQHKDNS